jgi:valyl-tRNA synthetase
VLEKLEAEGLLVRTEHYGHSVGQHDRCGTVIEPLLSRQWFVRMEPLAKPAIDVVERGEITFYPDRWRNVYMSWMNGIRDWCISRQLWWGHRIPVWYCDGCDHVTVSRADPAECGGCGGKAIRQDEDVLDTWFSSWLWTFSPMGWPDASADLERYHPTSVLVTGSEIIFFWVARMIMASLEFVGEIPFRHVFLTGIVRDGKGRKMSKSLGNSPDPLDIIDRWGTDPFRFTLSMLSPPGKDVFFDEEKLELGRNFLNKIWQASRMVTAAVENAGVELLADGGGSGDDPFAAAWNARYASSLGFEPELEWEDRWILSALGRAAEDINRSWEEWRLNEGTVRAYDFFWHDFCDWYLELAKVRLYGDGDKRTVLAVLLYVLGESLKMLHPLMPYVTEDIFDRLPMTEGLLLEAAYPAPEPALADTAADEQMELFRAVVTSTRNIRSQYHIPPGARIPLRVRTPEGGEARLEAGRVGIMQLARVDQLDIGTDVAKEKGSAVSPVGAYEVIVPLAGVVDLEAEYRRLEKEKDKIEKDLDRTERKLSNENFTEKASAEVVQRERDKREHLRTELETLLESMRIIRT